MEMRGVVFSSAVALVLVGGLAAPGYAYQRPGTLIRVNKFAGDELVHGASNPSTAVGTGVSADGRFVVFGSSDPALAAAAGYPGAAIDAAGLETIVQIFVYDVKLERLRIASLSSEGVPAVTLPGQLTRHPAISDSGRIIIFESEASNLVPGDTNDATDVFVHDMLTGGTTRASVTSDGKESTPVGAETDGNNEANPSLSGDGRYIAFQSNASDLVPGDDNDATDIFVHDLKKRTTVRDSVTPDGGEGSAGSRGPSISRGGRFTVFCSSATNLTKDGIAGLIRHDRRSGENLLVDRISDGSSGSRSLGGGVCSARAVSADGRLITFSAIGSDWIPNKSTPASWSDIYLRDVERGRTTRVNVSSYGEEAFGLSSGASISSNGRYVAFHSNANDLVEDDEGLCACPGLLGLGVVSGSWGDGDVFVHDLSTGATERLSINPNGSESNSCIGDVFDGGHEVGQISINSTGRFVSFSSCYDGMVDNDGANGPVYDFFLRDRGESLGTRDLGPSSSPTTGEDFCVAEVCQPPICIETVCIPPQGITSAEDPADDVDNILSRAGAHLYGASLAHRQQTSDLFVNIELEHMPAVGLPIAGGPELVYGLRFSIDGVRYEAHAQRLVGPDFDRAGGASFGLFRREPGTGTLTRVTRLRGGYGTTGERVVFGLPLADIGLEEGGRLSSVEAFVALGAYGSDLLKILDRVEIK